MHLQFPLHHVTMLADGMRSEGKGRMAARAMKVRGRDC